MTNNVFGGTLSLALSIYLSHLPRILVSIYPAKIVVIRELYFVGLLAVKDVHYLTKHWLMMCI